MRFDDFIRFDVKGSKLEKVVKAASQLPNGTVNLSDDAGHESLRVIDCPPDQISLESYHIKFLRIPTGAENVIVEHVQGVKTVLFFDYKGTKYNFQIPQKKE